MLHGGNENFIVWFRSRTNEALSNEINRFRGTSGEHDLAMGTRVEKMDNLLTCCLVQRCRSFRQVVHASMNVSIVMAKDTGLGFDDNVRLLRACCGIEKD